MQDQLKKIVKSSFEKVCKFDYAQKYTENEEDERATMYHHVRNKIKECFLDEKVRVFLSYSLKVEERIRKPDILIVSHKEGFEDLKTEIIIEMKNWPKKEQIIRDGKKLIDYWDKLRSDSPALYFCGVIGHNHESSNLEAYKDDIREQIGRPEVNIELLLHHHDEIYQGPWDDKNNTDPWRAKYRQ